MTYDGGTANHRHLLTAIDDADVDDATYTGDGATPDIYATNMQHDYTDAVDGAVDVRDFVRTAGVSRTVGAALVGYLAEEERTNLISNSDVVPWGELIGGATYTVDTGAAPDGSITADTVVFPVSTASAYVRVFNANGGSPVNGVVFAISFWARRLSGGTQLYAGTTDAATWAGQQQTEFALTDQWQRFTTIHTIFSHSSTTVDLNLMTKGQLGNPDLPPITFELWGIQLERADYASSYIKTTGSALARDKDELTYAWPAAYKDPTGLTTYAEMLAADGVIADEVCLATLSDSAAAATNFILLGFAGNALAATTRATGKSDGSVTGTNDLADGVAHQTRLTIEADDLRLIEDGSSVGTPDSDVGVADNLDQLDIGQFYNGSGQPNCLISNIRIFKKALPSKVIPEGWE